MAYYATMGLLMFDLHGNFNLGIVIYTQHLNFFLGFLILHLPIFILLFKTEKLMASPSPLSLCDGGGTSNFLLMSN